MRFDPWRDDVPQAFSPHFHPNHAPVEQRAWREDTRRNASKDNAKNAIFQTSASTSSQSPSNQDRAKISQKYIQKKFREIETYLISRAFFWVLAGFF